MNNKKSASSTSDKFQNPGMNITAGAASLSEVDALLSELLPHLSDADPSGLQEDGAVPYSKFRRVTLENGIKAVRLPDGKHIARALDRKTGSTFWTVVRG